MDDAPASAPDALTLDQLRLFLAVVDAGSFSAAARSLRRAQSAVSYGVGNLEKQLDVQLFDRTTRTPSLTPAGRELLTETREACAQIDHLRARARGIRQGVEPTLGLVVDHLFPVRVLARALAAFRQQFPMVSLTLHTEALGAVYELVARGVCAIGIGNPVPHVPEGLARRPVGRVTMVHVAAPGHPLGKLRGVLPARRVREHVQIVLADRSRLTEGQDFGVYTERRWRVMDLSTKHALLRAGLGWGGMPLHLVADDLARKRLVQLRLEEADAEAREVQLFAIHRTAEPPGPAATWLLGHLGARSM